MSWAKNLGYVIKQPMSKKTQQTLKDLETISQDHFKTFA